MHEDSPPPRSSDVQMRGFSRRATVAQTLSWLDGQLGALPGERVPLADAADRVLSHDIVSELDVPSFRRAMMDGFAVQAGDTQGGSADHRRRLRVIGQLLPGQPATIEVTRGTAVRIMTGAQLPPGADAVLPVETVEVEEDGIQVSTPVSPGKHVGEPAEDIRSGTCVLRMHRRLRPQDLGVLSSIGVGCVDVVRHPRVRVVVTGNELLPAGETPAGCRIADANSPMLAALVKRDGGIPSNPGIVPDEPSAILAAMRDDAELVLVSGGSSVGMEDHAPCVLARYGELPIHGVALRPGGPTGIGRLDDRLVFLLPGNPVSCLCAYDFFAGRAVRTLAGRRKEWPYPSQELILRRRLVSTVGRVEYARVRIVTGQVEPLAVSGASILSSTTRADGFVVVPEESDGFSVGSPVRVYCYDRL